MSLHHRYDSQCVGVNETEKFKFSMLVITCSPPRHSVRGCSGTEVVSIASWQHGGSAIRDLVKVAMKELRRRPSSDSVCSQLISWEHTLSDAVLPTSQDFNYIEYRNSSNMYPTNRRARAVKRP
jgi:hypothetical protein